MVAVFIARWCLSPFTYLLLLYSLLLQGWIDTADAQLATLHNFILPGGTPGSAALHMARLLMAYSSSTLAAL